MVSKFQVIRELQVSGKTKSADKSKRKYCLLDLENIDARIGPMINLGTENEPKWYIYKISKTFDSKEEAEKYSNEKNIRIVNDATVD